MIKFTHSGGFDNIMKFLESSPRIDPFPILQKYGAKGVSALASATPRDSGETATSWGYIIKKTKRGYTLSWTNSHLTSEGVPVAVLIQYGHGTRSGVYIQGRDFINPAIKPIFESMIADLGKEVG